MIQEFHLSVTPVGADTYLVRTERMAAGVPIAEVQVTWPTEAWLQQARQELADPVATLLTAAPNWAPNLTALGQQLFNALFQGRIRDSWMAAQSIAQHRRESLRLRLGLAAPMLQQLPWEVLHDSDRPLATGTEVVFSRYLLDRTFAQFPPRPRYRETPAPLRILMVIATPSDQERLELNQEFRDLQQELNSSDGMGSSPGVPMQMTLLNQPGRTQLTQALEQGQYDIVHYAGHSAPGAAGGSLYLVNDRTGLTELLSGDDLAGLLANNGVQMAVLNSCRGAYHDPTQAQGEGEQNLAQALLRRGIPAVLAMAERIPDEVAIVLSRLFYRNLNQGYPVDLSLSRARQGLMSSYGSNQLYWALPVLYLHPEFDAHLGLPSPAAAPAAGSQLPLPELGGGQRRDLPIPASMPPAADHFAASPLTLAADGLGLSDWEQVPATDSIRYWQQLATGTPPPLGSPSTQPEPLAADANFNQLMVDLAPSRDRPGDSAPDVTRLIDQLSTPGRWEERPSPPAQPLSSPSPSSASQPQPMPYPVNPGEDSLAEAADAAPYQIELSPRMQRGLIGLGAAIASFVVVLLLGTLVGQLTQSGRNAIPGLASPLPTLPQADAPLVPNTPLTDKPLAEQTVREVMATALQGVRDRDLVAMSTAIDVLLERNALAQAGAVLNEVPADLQDEAQVLFWRGRVAWQYARVGNPDYTVADAQRFWLAAVAAAPDTPIYRNALGFAYYATEDYSQASEQWLQALKALQAQRGVVLKTDPAAANQVISPALGDDPDALNAYAGLSIASSRLAPDQPLQVKQQMVSQSRQLCDTVFGYAPIAFTPTALADNWLWNEAAIADWQSLPERLNAISAPPTPTPSPPTAPRPLS